MLLDQFIHIGFFHTLLLKSAHYQPQTSSLPAFSLHFHNSKRAASVVSAKEVGRGAEATHGPAE